MNKEKVVKFSLDPSNQEHQKVIDFLDTLGRGMRVKWLLACARNFEGMHPLDVRKMIEATEEVKIIHKPIDLKNFEISSKNIPTKSVDDNQFISHKIEKKEVEIRQNVSQKKSNYSGLVKL